MGLTRHFNILLRNLTQVCQVFFRDVSVFKLRNRLSTVALIVSGQCFGIIVTLWLLWIRGNAGVGGGGSFIKIVCGGGWRNEILRDTPLVEKYYFNNIFGELQIYEFSKFAMGNGDRG